MKMIYVGQMSNTPDRDSGWVREFSRLGWEVVCFGTEIELHGSPLIRKFKKRFNIGSENAKLQKDLLDLARRERPIWIHFRLPIEFSCTTIMKLKADDIILTEYFNDDPFSSKTALGLHWKFRNALCVYDAHYVYRAHNIRTFQIAGAQHVSHCPPTYDNERHTLDEHRPDEGYLADAAFIGHWENDWRADCIEALHLAGFKLILKGGMWDRVIQNRPLSVFSPAQSVFGREYNRIYANSMIGLCFFSKINNDSWTERALEIVAVGGVLVCERTPEAETYFTDREEAFFFSSIEELISIVFELKHDLVKREKVRAAGYRRLIGGQGQTI